MLKLLKRTAVTLGIVLAVLGLSWHAWREVWSGEMLMDAINLQEENKVALLLRLGGEIPPGALFSAGRIPAVESLILHGADPDARLQQPLYWSEGPQADPYSDVTPTMFAVVFGVLDNIDALIESGADLNARTGDGSTALHFASQITSYVDPFTREQITRRLLEAGADPSIPNIAGQTPLSLWPDLGEIVAEVEAERVNVDETP